MRSASCLSSRVASHPEPDAEGGSRERGGGGEAGDEPAPRAAGPAGYRAHGLGQGRRHLGCRGCRAKQRVNAAETVELRLREVVADQVAQLLAHSRVSSRTFASRESPARVLVFTVPSGTSR